MESNQDQALMRGPPDHRANGPYIPLSGYAAGLVRLTAGLFERVRICTSHRATSWVPTSLACSGSSLSLEASTLARPAQGAFMGLTTRRRVSIPPPLNGATARLMRRGAAYVPTLLVAQQSGRRKRGRLHGRTPLPLEPRGGIEPPRPRRRSHGYGPAFCYSTRHISAYFLRLTKSRCGMPARRAPDRLACFAHSSSGFLSRFACVRLPRMGATQYSRWTELHSLGATLLLAPACWRIPSLHAPPGAAALQVSAHRGRS